MNQKNEFARGRAPRVLTFLLCSALGSSVSACGKSGSDSSPANGGRNDTGASGQTSTPNGGGESPPGGGGASGGSDVPSTPVDLTETTVVGVDGSKITTSLPLLPPLTNVVGKVREDSVGVSFDPVDGAADYRVYVLPKDADITGFSDGTLTVKNAVYRCAGMQQTFDLKNSLNANSAGLTTAGQYGVTAELDADDAKNTLGYVYVTPAADRLPVYQIGAYPMRDAEVGWRETRPKVYTTSADERAMLLAKGARDDGIAFYVPSTASDGTETVYSSQINMPVGGQDWTHYEQYYFTASGMADHKNDTIPPAPAFQVSKSNPGAGSEPLMRVFYKGTQSHDELSAGPERFRRAAYQGSGPLWYLEWAGLTDSTTLVIEALANGCPFQGFLAPQHLEAKGHQTFYTLDDLQKASPTGEAFINGQYDKVAGKPKPIARSFLTVKPVAHDAAAWDWYAGFGVGTDFGTPVEVPGCKGQNCGRWQTPDLDISSYLIDKADDGPPVLAYGQFLGQLWEAFDDVASDTTGKLRFTARTKGNIDSDPNKYFHATMSVDIVSTGRRYPQLIISDQDAPVQEGFANPNNNSLLLQPIQGPSTRLEVQAFHGLVAGLVGSWDVNNQAPEHRLIDYDIQTLNAQPSDSPFQHTGMDRMTRFDVFVSTKRLYAFMDGQPAGCTLFPKDFALSGPVTFTVGDVLYHEGAPDELVCANERPYTFMHVHQCTETKRHFDDLGFKSGSPPPTWDETKFPCSAY
ncbi:MAG: hypothetical protein ABUL62_08530 [Myxococcales bacterium]